MCNIADAFESHLRFSSIPCQFPRDIQFPRSNVKTKEQYITFMEHNHRRMNCYTSVYSDEQIRKRIVDCIFIEIDADDFSDATARSKVLEGAFEKMGIRTRKYFSGRRGFHYYIDLPPVRLKCPGSAVQAFIKSLPQVYDQHVLSGPRQMARTPFSQHQATKLYCVPMKGDFSIAKSITPVWEEVPLVDNPDMVNVLSILDEGESVKPKQKAFQPKFWPECVVNALNELQTTRELDHRQRLHLTAFLHHAGYTPDEIELIYKTYANDYKHAITAGQIRHVVKNNMACYTCRNVITMNLCPYASKRQGACDFYPSVNRTVGTHDQWDL